jgi:PAS domain S-box-containing protein
MTSMSPAERQQLFDALIGRLREFVVVLVSPSGHFSSWHGGVQQLFGYTQDEFVGKHVDLLLPLAERLRGGGRRELDRAAETGCTSETRSLVTKTGQKIVVEGVTVALRSPIGDLLGFGKVLRDVTRQKMTQEDMLALTRALDQSAVIVRQWDGTIDHWTSGCQRLYGWTPSEAIGRRCGELLHTSYPHPLDDIQRRLLEVGSWHGETRHVRKDGTNLEISAHWALLLNDDQDPLCIIETHSDITALISAQRELEAVNRKLQVMALELERSNQELEEFARIASHDLSAPITSTRWIVEMLARRHSDGLDEAGRKCVTQISQGLDRMAELVEGILAHARVGTTSMHSAELTHCEDALAVAIENLRSHIDGSGAGIRYSTLPAVELRPQALSQLFQNLLSNAIKYARKDVAPDIEIQAEWKGPMWMISVADNGIGIEPEWHERIFQPMQRRNGIETAGSGIGLATCKKIVSRVGGSIWVKSELGGGSVFYCLLPGPNPEAQEALHAAPAALDNAEENSETDR